MCVNKILLKTTYKQPFEYNTFLNVHTLSMGHHFLVILGVLAVDKCRKERLLTTSIAFLLLDC